MAKWHCNIPTKSAFIRQLGRAPELILVRGSLHGRFGLQSLPTVLDEFREVFVMNARVGWGTLVLRNSRNRLVRYTLSDAQIRSDAGSR
jgi:hypothetical protein